MALETQARITPNIELGSHLRTLAVTTQWVAVNKSAGFHSVPIGAADTSTVLNAVVAVYPECRGAFGRKAMEGGLVHRLDQGTSGVLVFARTQKGYDMLRRLWEQRDVEKDYLTWVSGSLNFQGVVRLQLAHSPKSKKRMIVVRSREQEKLKAWEAVTAIYPLARRDKMTLVLVRIFTGVTHQIRVTLATLGHPVVGDPVYRAPTKPLPRPWGKVLPAELKKSFETLAQGLKGSDSTTRTWPPVPQLKLLPHDSFYLHAYRLCAREKSAEPILRAGLVAPPPVWFGL